MDCGLTGLTFTKPSLCKPQFAADCDLTGIVKRFLKTGELPQFRERPTIQDATNMPSDFFEALRPAVEVQQAFDQLPLEERNKYNNDAESWFIENAAKAKEDASPETQPATGQPAVDPDKPPEEKPPEE